METERQIDVRGGAADGLYCMAGITVYSADYDYCPCIHEESKDNRYYCNDNNGTWYGCIEIFVVHISHVTDSDLSI